VAVASGPEATSALKHQWADAKQLEVLAASELRPQMAAQLPLAVQLWQSAATLQVAQVRQVQQRVESALQADQ